MKAKRLLSTLLSAAFAVSIVPASAFQVKADEVPQMSIKECIRTGFQNFNTEIDISVYKYSQDDFSLVGEMINDIKEEPDMFYFSVSSLKCSLKYDEDGNIILSKILTEYENDPESVEVLKAEYNQKCDQIIKDNIKDDMTDLEKALKLHDYLVLNSIYDTDNSIEDLNGGYSAYDIIVNNNGVCKGYAQAYKQLLEKAGVESIVVISEDMVHGWNLVKIDGNWYHVDVTWDDPVPDTPGRVNHAYFMLSDQAISKADENRKNAHYNWDSKGITADDTSYDNMFWNNIHTEIIISENNWYFVNSSGEYSAYVPEYNEVNTNVSLEEEPWYVWGSTSRFWTGRYTSIIISDDTVYFNTPRNIYKMKLDGSNKQHIQYVDPIQNDGYMYGLVLKNDELFAVIKQSPTGSSNLVKVMDLHLDNYSYFDTVIKQLEEMNDGSSDIIRMADQRVLPAKAIELIKGKDLEITLDCIEYKWNIKGQNVTTSQSNDINLGINKDQGIIPEEKVEDVADSQQYVEINLVHQGDLGFTADLSCNVGSQMADKNVVVYRYNEEKQQLEEVQTTAVNSKGEINVSLNNASNYAVVVLSTDTDTEPEGRPQYGTINGTITTPGFIGVEEEQTGDKKQDITGNGDISDDGNVDLTDLLQLSQYVLHDIELSEVQLIKADVNGDGVVDIADVPVFKQYVMNDITIFPAQKLK